MLIATARGIAFGNLCSLFTAAIQQRKPAVINEASGPIILEAIVDDSGHIQR